MKKLILVRYGEYTDGHLNDQGRQTMLLASRTITPFIEEQKVVIGCAKIARAQESANLLSESLQAPPAVAYDEFYSAEEDGRMPNLPTAERLINTLGQDCDTLIIVLSREYIEQLPAFILAKKEVGMTSLHRGEVAIIDYKKHSITIL